MKNIFLLTFIFSVLSILILQNENSLKSDLNFPVLKKKNKLPKEQRIDAQQEYRSKMLTNVETGILNPKDWYVASTQINKMISNFSNRAGSLEWKQWGPYDVGGRTRGIVFDKLDSNKMYLGSVSGGIWVSENAGDNWKQVANNTTMPIQPIGCMDQSIDGDIYAGTGEYWGNTPNGSFGTQFYGNGILKKEVGSDNFELSGNSYVEITNTSTFPNDLKMRFVIDIACDPYDNNKVYAGTENGLFISLDAGTTWNKLTSGDLATGEISQIKACPSKEGQYYAGRNGYVYKSTDGCLTWKKIVTDNAYLSQNLANNHLRIAVSHQNEEKLFVAGTGSGNDLKFVISTIDGGTTWTNIGSQDPTFQPLCSSDGTSCQGWYDLCLKLNISDDNQLFIGGQQAAYSWSEETGWKKIAFWTSPAKIGNNLVHADMHEIAFSPHNPEIMAYCTDGGLYISKNSKSKFPFPTFSPKNQGYIVTQFYDIAANIYGELLGGAQDNGTNLVSNYFASPTKSIENNGGDGFGCAISANNDYKLMFYTVYNGRILRSDESDSKTTNIVEGSAIADASGNAKNVGFNTKIHLAEMLESDNNDEDTLDKDVAMKGLFFIFHGNGMYMSLDANTPGSTPNWSTLSPGVGEPFEMHQSSDLKVGFVVGSTGVAKITGMDVCKYTTDGVGVRMKNVSGLTFNKLNVANNLGGVYVMQTNSKYVALTQFGFGGTNKIYYSIDGGTTFTGKQGNLPKIPVYSVVIDEYDFKHVIIGTEFGIFETDDITATSPNWEYSNNNMGRVPIFKLRQNKLFRNDCWVIYAGTHGKGFYYTKTQENSECSYTLGRPKNYNTPNGINYLSSLENKVKVYPNPTTEYITVEFNSQQNDDYKINIFSQDGKSVMYNSFKGNYGKNEIPKLSVSHLAKGTYFLRIENNNNVIGGSKFIVK